LFEVDARFGLQEWIIGAVFSASGLLVLVSILAFYRNQAPSGR
jgi:hypothetical protein